MDDLENEHYNPNPEVIKEIAGNYLIDEDTAEQVLNIMNKYGVDEEESVELEELGI